MKQSFVLILLCSAMLLVPGCWKKGYRSGYCGPVPCAAPVYQCDPCVTAGGPVVADGYTTGYYDAEAGVADVSYAQNGEVDQQEGADYLDEGSEDFENDMDLK